MDPSFKATLARWGFRPYGSNEQPQPVEPEPAPESDDKAESREIAKAILNGDGEVQI